MWTSNDLCLSSAFFSSAGRVFDSRSAGAGSIPASGGFFYTTLVIAFLLIKLRFISMRLCTLLRSISVIPRRCLSHKCARIRKTFSLIPFSDSLNSTRDTIIERTQYFWRTSFLFKKYIEIFINNYIMHKLPLHLFLQEKYLQAYIIE